MVRRTPKPARKLSTAAIVAGAKLPRTDVQLCVRGDLIANYQAADEKLHAALAEAAPGESLAGTPEGVLPLAEAVEAIRQEMQDYTLKLVVQALPRQKWKDLEAEHPPRRSEDGGVHDEDRRFGVDVTTFFPVVIPLCVVEPDDLTAELWAELLTTSLTDGQIEDLCATIWNLNQGKVAVPFSPAASRILSTFGKK